ncbi:phage tail protein [Alterisphingorhabdus coralli]|uniref:Phage tail protein n=1 Tax=Alterisphingorhabdus coralli TaxID=3071408 RepID=A0AA97FAL2_9SPHN|nr:phage tail protein [Parasphingorhabdus sp. SCSIO 66989]WOE76327.1 phage tail protein [Parasphingorhabdus sp. SCSIO 66989]
MAGKGGQTVGYHYLMTIVAGIGRGPVDELHEIAVGEKTVIKDHFCDTGPFVINEPELFGGEGKEGGIQGGFYVNMGAAEQVLPPAQNVVIGSKPVRSVTVPDIKQDMGGLVSEFRGFVSVVFDGLVASMNPYLKEWKFRVRRHRAGWFNNNCWYEAKAPIYLANGEIHAMNPAHIVYECLTNPEWGKGEDPASIDENSFIYAANLFCSESFGLCIKWNRQGDVDDFIETICDHVGALVYMDRVTGKYVLKVLRGDYDPQTIPHFDLDSGLLSIVEDDSGSSEQVNEIIVKGFDPRTRQQFEVRAQNIAAWQAHGGPISRTIEHPGLSTTDLGGRVAQRELLAQSPGLKKFRLEFDRRAWQLTPGAVIRISSSRNNISNLVVRLGKITEGATGSGKIMAGALEDVFAMPETSFNEVATSTWTPPITDPSVAPAERLIELGYRDLYRILGPGDLAAANPDDTSIGALAVSPGSGSFLYDLASQADGETDFEINQSLDYTGSATLVDPVGALDTVLNLNNLFAIDEESVDQMVMVDDELMWLSAFDTVTGLATVVRGCGDTIPAPHAALSRLWVVDDDIGTDGRTYLNGERVNARVLPRTSSRVLPLADAALLTADMIGRQARPYPPADVRVSGTSIYTLTGEHVEPVLSWSHRDRIIQEDQPVGHLDASIGPEQGVSYTVRVFDLSGNLVRQETDILGTSWTYTNAMQTTDSPPSVVRMELDAARDGISSWQRYSFPVFLRSGYGFGYGLNYGGA